MEERHEKPDTEKNTLQTVADTFFEYLRDVIYYPSKASLDLTLLPDEFVNFGKGLLVFNNMVSETRAFAKELARGNLDFMLPLSGNEIAAPLKSLHASLRHLTWQTQQVANGDYKQHVDFMGTFSEAFNHMIKQLEQRHKISLDERSRLELYVHLMLANCPDPLLLFDRKGKLAYVSDSYLACCGITDLSERYMIINASLSDLLAPVVSDEFLSIIQNRFETAVAEKHTVKMEHEIDFSREGFSRHYEIQLTPMLDANGDVEGVIIFLHDTTDIVRARELAERSSRAKSDFLARMSHEMRTPMNAIIGMSAIYEATPEDNQERKNYCIERIKEASRNLLGVINDVLDMSNIETDKFDISRSGFNFRKMIDKIAGVVMFSIRERGQMFTINIDPDIPEMIFTDEQRLAQVIINLLTNSIKFTPNEREISLDAAIVPDNENSTDDDSFFIRFVVKDDGIGISPEQLTRLFEPFEQADGGISRQYGGTGLGLPISKRIVEMLGGNIIIESELGKGAAFIFEIKVGRVTAEESYDSGKHRPESDNSAPDDGIFIGKTILLVEDVEVNREILIALIEHTGAEIEIAVDGADALMKFATSSEKYDLILMDIHMPNMDGFETTSRIRKSSLSNAETIPIIAMTANVSKEDIEKCLACGMNSHLGKPVDPGEIINRLKKYML